MSLFSDESDLTDLSSDEEDTPLSAALTTAPSTRKKGKQKEEYVLKRPLKPPRSTTYSASGIYGALLQVMIVQLLNDIQSNIEMIVQGTIDLDPEYQRGILIPNNVPMFCI